MIVVQQRMCSHLIANTDFTLRWPLNSKSKDPGDITIKPMEAESPHERDRNDNPLLSKHRSHRAAVKKPVNQKSQPDLLIGLARSAGSLHSKGPTQETLEVAIINCDPLHP